MSKLLNKISNNNKVLSPRGDVLRVRPHLFSLSNKVRQRKTALHIKYEKDQVQTELA